MYCEVADLRCCAVHARAHVPQPRARENKKYIEDGVINKLGMTTLQLIYGTVRGLLYVLLCGAPLIGCTCVISCGPGPVRLSMLGLGGSRPQPRPGPSRAIRASASLDRVESPAIGGGGTTLRIERK